MSTSRRKLRKGARPFTYTDLGKFFHLQSALLSSPIYPQHAEAFKIAANMILDAHQSADRGPHHDTLVFPVLYLYRHCLELKLKDLVMLGVRTEVFVLTEVEEMLGKHNLCPLWTKAKELIQDSYPDDDEAAAAESMINEFHRIDRDGQTLRYDREKQSLKLRRYESLPSHISVVTLRSTMNDLYHYLDYCYAGILDSWDAGQQAMPQTHARSPLAINSSHQRQKTTVRNTAARLVSGRERSSSKTSARTFFEAGFRTSSNGRSEPFGTAKAATGEFCWICAVRRGPFRNRVRALVLIDGEILALTGWLA